MALVLTQQVETKIPIEIPGVTPDGLSGKSLPEVERISIWHGRQENRLADLFKCSGDLSGDQTLVLEGILAPVHGIGAQMRTGIIEVRSNAGRRVGCQMAGGEIRVSGNVSDFLGAEMSGGSIRVSGNAGDSVGGQLPGSKIGMNRGSILVRGCVGKGTGQTMRRGTIVVGGSAEELLGWNMLAGTIVVLGDCGPRAGAEMRRGTIVLAGGSSKLTPTFVEGIAQPAPVLAMLANWIQSQEFEFDVKPMLSEFKMYHGDTLHGGRGEVFVRQG